MVRRTLDLARLLGGTGSAFLFGARGTGKTHLVREFLSAQESVLAFDLLGQKEFLRFLHSPGLFREEVMEALPRKGRLLVLVDEVQRVPALLNEVHALINDHAKRVQFILTGSSARRLKRGGANLLAGRAYVSHLHPLTQTEFGQPLKKVLRYGSLPGLALGQVDPHLWLEAYTSTYLKEEIQQEALVRRVDSFVRFLDLAAQLHAEPVNFTRMARQGIASVPTIQEYFSILIDTMVAFRLDGWSESVKKQLLQAPKFYFFDLGVLNALRGELGGEPAESSFRYGRLFETLVILEACRRNDYARTGYRLAYWRTSMGMEVDLVLQKNAWTAPVAIEIKSSADPSDQDLKGLLAFLKDYPKAQAFCFCRAERKRRAGPKGVVQIVPWQKGLDALFPQPRPRTG